MLKYFKLNPSKRDFYNFRYSIMILEYQQTSTDAALVNLTKDGDKRQNEPTPNIPVCFWFEFSHKKTFPPNPQASSLLNSPPPCLSLSNYDVLFAQYQISLDEYR